MNKEQSSVLTNILNQIDPSLHERIVIFCSSYRWAIGVLAIDLQADDFFYLPVELEAQQVLPESIAVAVESKNPHGLRISDSDSGRTRTYNQLIKSQLSRRAAHCRKSRKQAA